MASLFWGAAYRQRRYKAKVKGHSLQEIWYTISERFDPSYGESWTNYINWSRLTQLKRVVSVDSLLNPSVIEKYNDEDWLHNIKADYLTDYFSDLNYLLSRIPLSEKLNLLAVILEPTEDISTLVVDKDFVFFLDTIWLN